MNKKSSTLDSNHKTHSDATDSGSMTPRVEPDGGVIEASSAITEKHWEVILNELVHLMGSFITHSNSANGIRTTDVLFNQLVHHLEILTKMPGHGGSVLIRRTDCKVPVSSSDPSYFAVCGNLMIKAVPETTSAHYQTNIRAEQSEGALKQAFKCFSEQGIHSLYIKMPGNAPDKVDQLRVALNIMARFNTSVKEASSIRFRCYGRALTFSVINDANGLPDANLTLTAALNGLSPINARELVKQANALYTFNNPEAQELHPTERMSSYNQIFSVRGLRSQIVKPPVEVNNFSLLSVDPQMSVNVECQPNCFPESTKDIVHPTVSADSYENGDLVNLRLNMDGVPVTIEQIRQLISQYINIDSGKHRDAIAVLGADDYGALDPATFGERLVSMTQLLYALDNKCQNPAEIDRVVEFIRHRFQKLQHAVLTNIIAQRQGLKFIGDGRTVIVGLVHPLLFDLITLMSEHVAASRRMSIIKDIAFGFDPCHTANLADAFGISEHVAQHILEILRDCFTTRGSFIRPTFEGRIGVMSKYENAIFEILWCFLKETPRRQDRLDFLNALQLLMAKLSNPKRATQFLLANICQSISEVEFTDRNAFSLANILLQHENKELYVDINRTPENVLTTRGRLINREVKRYAVWRLDVDSVRMLTKLRTIYRTLQQTLGLPPGTSRLFNVSFLMALEREALIFIALVGGLTARTYLREALERYGTPDSDIYQHDLVVINISDIIAQLQIVVRSLGLAGNVEDIKKLKTLQGREKAFYRLDSHPAHMLHVKQLMKYIQGSIKMIQA